MSSRPVQQITGLASGLDTASIVDQLLALQRTPLVQTQQQEAGERARQQALNAVRTQLQSLSSTVQGLRDVGAWSDVQSVSSSDPTKLGASRTGGAAAGAFAVAVAQLARAGQVAQQSQLAAAAADDTLEIAVGSASVSVPVAAGDSIDEIARRINTAANTPVFASAIDGKLVLSGRATGAVNRVTVTSAGSLATDLDLAETFAPRDALYSVDGGPEQSSATNTVANGLPGISLTLQAVGTTTVAVSAASPSTDAIAAKVAAFVAAYNQTVDLIRSKLNEQKVVDPQNDADRARGSLRGDAALSALLTRLRRAVGDPVDLGGTGSPRLPAQVGLGGVTTGGGLDADAVAGKLTFDRARLAAALGTDFAGVKGLFTNRADTDDRAGIAQRLDGLLGSWTQTGGVVDVRLQAQAARLKQLQNRETALNVRLDLTRRRLDAQFANLETVLSQSRAQGDWLAGQIARLNAPSGR